MTATATGTAAGHDALLTALKTFLTTDATLVAAGENWSVDKEETISSYTMTGVTGQPTYTGNFHDLYLRGPGASGTDNIHVNLRAYQDNTGSLYNWMVSGATGFNTLADWEAQPNTSLVSGNFSYFPLTNASISYLFIANGRRFIIRVTIDGDTYVIYCGFILQYALPSEYPYPLVVTGTASSPSINILNSALRNFYAAGSSIRSALREPDGVWNSFSDSIGTSISVYPFNIMDVASKGQLRGHINGDFPGLAAIAMTTNNGGNAYGEFDGLFFVPKINSTNLAAADTVTISTIDHEAEQNAQITDQYQYALLRKD